MKITVIGGGGVRSPLFVMTLLRWQQRVGVDELCLLDIDERKLRLIGPLCRELVNRSGEELKVTTTIDPRFALTGADHVVTTIRPGFEEGRAIDERIALKHGVLGQETTGPGGFAMALRSIPAILGYAGILREVNPRAWMYNFTNPAGLVTQGVRDAGYDRIVGICDGANGGQIGIAGWANVEVDRIRAEVYGLNHLSWCRRAWLDGEDLMPRAVNDERFIQEAQGAFEPALVRQTGMYMNEYLYYYHYAERAVASILSEEKTRGEEIVELNKQLLDQLESINVERNTEQALRVFFGYEQRRAATYMHYAYGGPAINEVNQAHAFDADIPANAGEGYAGVALSLIEAISKDVPLHTSLNVPNNGSIQGMADDDVVEVSCLIDGGGVHVQPVGDVPAPQLSLMRSVKLYERLTVRAIREKSISLAVQALMAHPLVLSYSRAKPLVDEYLAAHKAYVGEWR